MINYVIANEIIYSENPNYNNKYYYSEEILNNILIRLKGSLSEEVPDYSFNNILNYINNYRFSDYYTNKKDIYKLFNKIIILVNSSEIKDNFKFIINEYSNRHTNTSSFIVARNINSDIESTKKEIFKSLSLDYKYIKLLSSRELNHKEIEELTNDDYIFMTIVNYLENIKDKTYIRNVKELMKADLEFIKSEISEEKQLEFINR